MKKDGIVFGNSSWQNVKKRHEQFVRGAHEEEDSEMAPLENGRNEYVAGIATVGYDISEAGG